MPLPPVPTFHPVPNADAVVTAKNVRCTVLTDRLIRLEYSKDDRFEDRPSQAFWHREQPVPKFKKTVTDSSIEIETDFLHLTYQVTAKGFTAKTLSIKLKHTDVTWKYGAKQSDNLKGTYRTLDMATHPLSADAAWQESLMKVLGEEALDLPTQSRRRKRALGDQALPQGLGDFFFESDDPLHPGR